MQNRSGSVGLSERSDEMNRLEETLTPHDRDKRINMVWTRNEAQKIFGQSEQ